MTEVQSIEARLRARLDAKTKHRTKVLKVDGFEDMFAARYYALTYKELCKIRDRHEGEQDEVDRELIIAADILATACEEVYAVEDGKRNPLGLPWSPELAQRLGLPHVSNGRQCLLSIFVDDIDLIAHRNAYFVWRDATVVEVQNETAGNSAT